MNYYLIVDTEVSGFLVNRLSPFTKVEDWPRIRQISWLILDSEYEITEIKDYFTNSVDIKEILNEFHMDIKVYNPIIVGHNIDYDKNVIGAEIVRCEMFNYLIHSEKICTMLSNIDFCNLPNYKYPTLQELHYKIFNKHFEGHHNSKNDIIATKNCFVYLKKKNHDFFIQQEEVSDYPKYEKELKIKQNSLLTAKHQCWALYELLRIFRIMPSSLTVEQEIDFLNNNYFNFQSIVENQQNKKSFSDLLSIQREIIEKEELRLIDVLRSKEKKQLYDNLPAGEKLIGFILFSQPDKNKEELVSVAKEFQFYVIKYELLRRTFDNKNEENRNIGNLGIPDIHKMLRFRFEKKLIDLTGVLNMLNGLYHPDIFDSKLNRPIEIMDDEIKELDTTVKFLKPYLANDTEFIQIVALLVIIQERVPISLKPRITETIKYLEKKEGCYIATMCYNSYSSKEVLLFRKYRDNVLLKNVIGTKAVNLYYKYSPKFVKTFKTQYWIHYLIKNLILNPFYFILKYLNKKL